MHLGPETDYNYMMEENMIANTMEEKDLGIIIDNMQYKQTSFECQTSHVVPKSHAL
jgi:hypothetical protein